jgi:glycosyltransferase involved in cell wall biosynthesis
MKTRLAFVVQRYGLEIAGGSETHCRQVVERLAPSFDIEVITTCAQDYWTWENAYPPGTTTVNGIPVHRFPTIRPRSADFGKFSAQIFGRPHTYAQELKWLYDQGPLAPELLTYIAARRDRYDLFVFFTYIYYPTALGLRLVPNKSLLVPTAHDEPSIYFDLYKALFHSPRAILYNTEEERAFVHSLFGNHYIPHQVVGVGVEIPAQSDPDSFRHKFGVSKPYALYVGRIVSSKGCQELLDYFIRFNEDDAMQLVLAGRTEMDIPNRPDILYAGYISEEDKFDAMAGATALIMPSQYESLSMVTLESWVVGRPVVCTAACRVVASMCRRSNGGLYYRNADEFGEILRTLLAYPKLQRRLGENGHEFVLANYTWDVVERKYVEMIERVLSQDWKGESQPELTTAQALTSDSPLVH